MASTARLCLGAASGNGGALWISGNSAQPWYPSNTAEDNTTTGRNIRTLEIFFFVTTTTNSGDYIISCKNTGNGFIVRWYFNSNNTISFTIADANSNTIVMTVPFSGTTILNTWWHAVMFADRAAGLWRAYVGRVGINVNGTTGTSDSWPYTITGSAAMVSGVDRMLGLRTSSANNTHLVLGGFIGTYAGTSVSSSSRIQGGIAEFRVWSSNRGDIPAENSGSLMDLRDRFIDSSEYPDLVHCFRCNDAATTALDFDDVGWKDTRFTTNFFNDEFASSPIPAVNFATETRVGQYKLLDPDVAPEQRQGAYKISVPQTPIARIGGYKIRTTPAATTRPGDYKISAPFTETRDGGYKITSMPAAQERTGTYVIAPPPSPAETLERVGQYRFLTGSGTETRAGGYKLAVPGTETRVGGYKFVSAIGTESRVGSYKLASSPTEERVGGYKLSVPGQLDRTGSYTIAGQPTEFTISRMGKYKIYNVSAIAEEALRRLKTLRQRTG